MKGKTSKGQKFMKSRGIKWQRLDVSARIGIDKRISSTLTTNEKKRLRLTSLLSVFESGEPAHGTKLLKISWANPDANHFRSIDRPSSDFIRDDKLGLPTLNRGNWFTKLIKSKLESIGGKFNLASKPTSKRAKEKRKVGKKSKALANVGKRKRAKGKGKRMGSHRRIS